MLSKRHLFYVYLPAHAYEILTRGGQKRALGTLELALEAFVNQLVGAGNRTQ